MLDVQIQVPVEVIVKAGVSRKELGYALFSYVQEVTEVKGDAGCDWLTDGETTYIGSSEWSVSHDPKIARLVDAANVLVYNELYTIGENDEERQS